jgi:YT521-B-like domain
LYFVVGSRLTNEKTAENVYLIFSANKSGEYFGYARMASSIDDEAMSHTEPPALAGPAVPNLTDLPVTIPTPPTEFAPQGRIIDDSARGTIFWEADVDTEDEEQKPDDSRLERATESDDAEAVSPATPQSFGKPFKIEWVSTERLPFYRTRGLRNPWNANREVKIARDGTELEPSVGRRLVSMFHNPQLAPLSAQTRGQPPQGQVYLTSMAYMQHPPSG